MGTPKVPTTSELNREQLREGDLNTTSPTLNLITRAGRCTTLSINSGPSETVGTRTSGGPHPHDLSRIGSNEHRISQEVWHRVQSVEHEVLELRKENEKIHNSRAI
ncbi:hypothetical protein PIB30_037042 [Stylosanthes scabra]|uniref:Uncharacterized protein n=1 Tax=Stylosanthes scabra TaxID=79078 RepID=A0ABU6TDU4_9FABA|nr:hypothetical protein [Stylosanthes scabra]